MSIALQRVLFMVLTALAAVPMFVPTEVPTGRVPFFAEDHSPTKIVVDVVGRDFRWHFRSESLSEKESDPLRRGQKPREIDLPPKGLPPFRTGSGDLALAVNNAASDRELRLPVGTRVELRFHSEDFVYFFTIPELGIRQIAVPGLVHTCVCESVEPAAYDLRVDPLCGFRFYHDELMGRVVIEKNARFQHSPELP